MSFSAIITHVHVHIHAYSQTRTQTRTHTRMPATHIQSDTPAQQQREQYQQKVCCWQQPVKLTQMNA